MPTPITLLIAYPKELIRAGLREMLSKSSIRVVAEAEDGASTLSLTKKHKPDVLLVDAAIPGADCFDLLGKIRQSVPGTKFIVLSALEISVETVKEHVQNVLRKLEAKDRTGAAVLAVRSGMV